MLARGAVQEQHACGECDSPLTDNSRGHWRLVQGSLGEVPLGMHRLSERSGRSMGSGPFIALAGSLTQPPHPKPEKNHITDSAKTKGGQPCSTYERVSVKSAKPDAMNRCWSGGRADTISTHSCSTVLPRRLQHTVTEACCSCLLHRTGAGWMVGRYPPPAGHIVRQ